MGLQNVALRNFYIMIFPLCILQDMSRVSLHFVRGNNPKKFASTIVNFMGKVCSLLTLFIYFFFFSYLCNCVIFCLAPCNSAIIVLLGFIFNIQLLFVLTLYTWNTIVKVLFNFV